MDTIGPSAPLHGSTRMFIHDDDFTRGDHVLIVSLKQLMGLQCGVDVMQQIQIRRGVEAVARLKEF